MKNSEQTEIKEMKSIILVSAPWLSRAGAGPGARLHAETPPCPPPGTGRNQMACSCRNQLNSAKRTRAQCDYNKETGCHVEQRQRGESETEELNLTLPNTVNRGFKGPECRN